MITPSTIAIRSLGLWLFWFAICSCNKQENPKTLFEELSPKKTGIDFINHLREDDEFNIIEYLYFYNGGGVAVGDINNDGLIDLYFSSNQEPNKLFLNKGNFKFEDISLLSNVSGLGNWKTGVTMADVNGDGYLDIFSCGVGGYKGFTGQNQLLINKGDLTFEDKTEEYKLSFQGFSTQATFFDYDKDGDLDMFLLNHSVHSIRSYGDVMLRQQSDPKAGDRLYRNDLIPSGKVGFTEVTSRANINSSQIGYGLGVGISDLNNDGYLDIYVSNDFHENDYLYINQQDGSFKQELERSMAHSSRFSMGNDIGDINNDGWQDIVTLDMLPKDESILKASGGEDPYDIFTFKLNFGYHYQVARNSLQLNRGVNSIGDLSFSDIAPFAGVEATDWSWGPLLADFDNDGFLDFFVANGIVRRPNDLDYINYISSDSAQRFLSNRQMIDKMPSGKVSNFIFRNTGKLTFEDVSETWMKSRPSLSNGAAYADLDNDGDLDLILNHIDEPASVYRNNVDITANYLTVMLEGNSPNNFGIGTKVILHSKGLQSAQELMPTRGWLSSSSYQLHFGLGKESNIDSLVVIWPDGYYEKLETLKANQTITLKQINAKTRWSYKKDSQKKLLTPVDVLQYRHVENPYSDFESERLIPHSLSSQGPKMSIGDVNGDRLDDVFIGGPQGKPCSLFIQSNDGFFLLSSQKMIESDSLLEDTASAFFDADGDKDLDLVVVSSGQVGSAMDAQPRLYVNDGKGNFKRSVHAFGDFSISSTCIVPCDFDQDGDMDIFIGARSVVGDYGISPKSYLFTNDGTGKFTDESNRLPQSRLGMITSAVWTNMDGNERPDLIVVGEWMPVTILLQEPTGNFSDQTKRFGFDTTHGWWNIIIEADVDGDGDMDFLVGNAGLNSRFKVSMNEPLELWVGDIDGNGSSDPIMTYYNNHNRYPFLSKDQLIKQVPTLKKKFLKYENFRNVKLEDIIAEKENSQFVKKRAETFASVWIENKGNGGYEIHKLPIEAQLFPIFAFSVDDLNGDQIPDIIAVGNWYEVQPELGRQDAGYGLVLLGQPNRNFTSLTQQQTDFFVKGQGRDIKIVVNGQGDKLYLVSLNNDKLLSFK
ncbi:MAG: VCBS repeat-containing protein [Cyclobacteriaceae bacterium]|nr:VCBS repeat-containing protein [Cyclobacteriaceae bacterium]